MTQVKIYHLNLIDYNWKNRILQAITNSSWNLKKDTEKGGGGANILSLICQWGAWMKKTVELSFYRSFSFFGFARYDRTKYVIPTFKLRDTTPGYPYISGDLFRAFSDHIVDATGVPFYPQRVKEGNIVFVKTKYLRRFIKYMHPLVKNRYILITHNGDEEAPGDYARLLEDDKIIAWGGMNATLAHPKLIPLPLGGANPGKDTFFEKLIEEMQQNPLPKKRLLYMNIGITTHPDRPALKSYFATQPFCTVQDPRPPVEYLQELMRSKFTISPRGNGIDCCRVWESLLLGTIPVLKTTALDHLYQDLPVVIVDDWKEVTQEFLEKKYDEMAKKDYNFDKCYADYWLKLFEPYTKISERCSRLKKTSRVETLPKTMNNLRSLFWPLN